MHTLMVFVAVLIAGVAEANPEKTFILPGGAEIEMVWIEPGTFVMGSDTFIAAGDPRPLHQVTLTRGFWMGKYEVTVRQWYSVVDLLSDEARNYIDSRYVTKLGDDYPVFDVSRQRADSLLVALNGLEGISYWRMPTEAEWEYVCRAGTTTDWFWGDDPGQYEEYGWRLDYTDRHDNIHPVGQKLPNPWGVYDLYGNALEWCQDWYARYSEEPQVDPLQTEAELVSWNELTCLGSTPCRLWVVRCAAFERRPRVADRWGARQGDYIGLRLVRDDPERATSVTPETWGQIKKGHYGQ